MATWIINLIVGLVTGLVFGASAATEFTLHHVNRSGKGVSRGAGYTITALAMIIAGILGATTVLGLVWMPILATALSTLVLIAYLFARKNEGGKNLAAAFALFGTPFIAVLLAGIAEGFVENYEHKIFNLIWLVVPAIFYPIILLLGNKDEKAFAESLVEEKKGKKKEGEGMKDYSFVPYLITSAIFLGADIWLVINYISMIRG